MAKKKFLKGSEEWMLFQDFWGLCQSFWLVEDTETYWEEMIDQVEEFRKKYPGEFPKDLAYALIRELERMSRQAYEENN